MFAEFPGSEAPGSEAPGSEARGTPRPPWRVRDMLYGVGLLILSLGAVVGLAVLLGFPTDDEGGQAGAAAAVSTIAFELLFGAAVLLLAYRRGLGLAGLGFVRPSRWGPAVVAWLGAYGILIAYGALLLALQALGIDVAGFAEGNTLPIDADSGMAVLALFGVAVVVVAPFAEELLFRALLFRGMRGYWPLAPSLALSGLAFGVFHVNPSVILPFAGIGALFAWANEQTGSLWTSITAHAAVNGISFALSVTVIET